MKSRSSDSFSSFWLTLPSQVTLMPHNDKVIQEPFLLLQLFIASSPISGIQAAFFGGRFHLSRWKYWTFKYYPEFL